MHHHTEDETLNNEVIVYAHPKNTMKRIGVGPFYLPINKFTKRALSFCQQTHLLFDCW